MKFQKCGALEFYYTLRHYRRTMEFWNYILLELWMDERERTDESMFWNAGMNEAKRMGFWNGGRRTAFWNYTGEREEEMASQSQSGKGFRVLN